MKKTYTSPTIEVVLLQPQIIATSPGEWNSESVHIEIDLDTEDDGFAE